MRARIDRRRVTIVAMVVGMLAFSAPAAIAACHLADFTEAEHTVAEDGNSIDLTVFLIGRQPQCEGTIRYETVDGTATAGVDYTANSGELRFVSGDSREETITVEILDNERTDGDRTFRVRLIGVSGSGIQPAPGGGEATVTIADDDEAAQPTSPTPTEEESPPITGTPPTTDQEVLGDEDGGSTAPLIAAIIALAAAAGAGMWFWRRRAA